jgi:PAS domain S-box-containing protein
MDQALRQERDRVQMYLDIARVMIVVLTAAARSPSSTAGGGTHGYTEIELLGRNWFEVFVPEEERGPVVGSFRRIIDGELQPTRISRTPSSPRRNEEAHRLEQLRGARSGW